MNANYNDYLRHADIPDPGDLSVGMEPEMDIRHPDAALGVPAILAAAEADSNDQPG